VFNITLPEIDVGLLSSIGNAFKSVVKVIDNPVTRGALGVAGLSNVGAALSAAAGNQAAVNAQLGAAWGSTYQGGNASTPTFNPAVISGSKQMIFGNNLFPSIPGVSGAAPGGAPLTVAGYTLVKRRRRMNPTNIKAARRAIRRIRSTRRVLQRIERLLPTRTVHSRRK
jgi:hypothetical protein